jgi:hypothetical protein
MSVNPAEPVMRPNQGMLIQQQDWPKTQWAEVIVSSGAMIRIVRYTPNGNARWTEEVDPACIRAMAQKLDIPPLDFITGEVDVADGKLGVTRRRWSSRITTDVAISPFSPQRCH